MCKITHDWCSNLRVLLYLIGCKNYLSTNYSLIFPLFSLSIPLSIPLSLFIVSQQLNDGGKLISEMVKNDKELGQSGVDIRVWTGDTMTAASVYQQLVALPDLQQLFYIGANGKIGTAVCQKLVQRGISVRIFSKYEGIYLFICSFTQPLLSSFTTSFHTSSSYENFLSSHND